MLSLLPLNLQDTSNLAIEKCINKALMLDLKPFMISLIDTCPENILFYIAERFSLTDGDGWENCANIAEKRKLIKNAYKIHKMKATVKCVKNLLALNIKYLEWDEYAGIPNHFKLLINFDDAETNITNLQKILSKIENNKRLSAKLDGYDVVNASQSEYYIASRFKYSITAKCLPIEDN